MATLSLLEKIGILLEVSKSSILFIISLIIILVFGLILITTNKTNVKSSRKLFIAFYLFILVSTFVLYRESLINMLNYLMNNLFVAVYFPNLAIYFAAIIIANIILWLSVFNFRTKRIIKNINIIVYLVISYLLVVLLSIVNDNKLDVFNQASVYSNQTARAIIELTSTLFVTWIIFLVLYKAIIIYLTRNNVITTRSRIKSIKKNEKKKTTRIIVKNAGRRLPKNVSEVDAPRVIKNIPIEEPVITKSIPANEYDSLLTIDDYKLLLSMLKEKKEKDRLKKQFQDKESEKFEQLQSLYGVRG